MAESNVVRLRSSVVSGCVLVAVSFSGCSSLSSRSLISGQEDISVNTVATDVANARKGNFEVNAERDSEAIHNFLVGQLSLGSEDYQGALKHFERAAKLAGEPDPLVYSKMADLYLRFGELDKAERAAKQALEQSPSEPYVRMLYAGVLEALGRDREAEPIYKALVNEYPAKIDGYLLLSNLYMKEKNFDRATEVLLTLARNQPNEPAGHFYLGKVYEARGKLDKAETEYRWVFDRDPNATNGATELLRVLVRQEKTAKIKRVCDKIISQDPNNELARKVLSHIMIGENKFDDALAHLTALESIEEDPSETRFKVALIQIEKQNYREAIRELSLVLAKNPKHAEARYYLASLYAGSGKRKEAIEELAAIERDSPMYVKARTFAAYVYRQQDDLDGALESVDQALEAEPDNLNLTLYSVLISRDMGNYKQAEKKLRQALEVYPNDERVQFNLAVVLHERGNEAEALKLMERIVEVNPKNSDALNFVAYAHAESGGDLKRAEELARRALEIKSGDGYYLDTLGFVQFKRGDLKLAEETLSRAVASTGQDPVIIEHYVEVLLAQGKEREVISLLKSIADLELLGEDLRDKDKVSALKRLKDKLQLLLKNHPELSGVDKSRLLKPLPQQSVSLALPGLDLLDDSGDKLEISEVTR